MDATGYDLAHSDSLPRVAAWPSSPEVPLGTQGLPTEPPQLLADGISSTGAAAWQESEAGLVQELEQRRDTGALSSSHVFPPSAIDEHGADSPRGSELSYHSSIYPIAVASARTSIAGAWGVASPREQMHPFESPNILYITCQHPRTD
jgi:hypothetical protein